MPSAGNRVRTVDNERLDNNDFQALFDLVYGWIQYTHGMIGGVGEGVLSPPTVTYEVVGPVRQIRLGECTLYAAQNEAAATNRALAYPVVYDPTDANQLQTTIDITAYSNSYASIWWTVDLTNTDLDNRRVWEAGYPDGRAVAMLTRQRQRIRWTTSANFNTAPAEAGTWFRAGRFSLPASGAPYIVWCHAFDYGFNIYAGTGAPPIDYLQRWVGQWVFQDGYNSADNTGRSFGLSRLVSQLAMRVLTMLDSDYTFDPQTLEILTGGTTDFATNPAAGLAQLDTSVTAAEADIAVLEPAVTSLQAARTLWCAQVSAAGVASAVAPFAALSVAQGPSAGEYTITFDSAAPSGSIIQNTTATPIATCASGAALHVRAFWDSAYVVKVWTYDSSHNTVNSAFGVQLVGVYA